MPNVRPYFACISLYLPYISLYLPYISLCLPYISPTSPYISTISPHISRREVPVLDQWLEALLKSGVTEDQVT